MPVKEKNGRIVFQAKGDTYARFFSAKGERQKQVPGTLFDAQFAREVFEIGLKIIEKRLGLR